MAAHHSLYTKQRIINLHKKNKKQTDIVKILEEEDDTSITRQTVAATIGKYQKTGSIYRKARPERASLWKIEYYDFIDKTLRDNDETTSTGEFHSYIFMVWF